MGGFGALMLAMKPSDLFSSAVSYGAAVVKFDVMLRMEKRKVTLPAPLNVTTAPKYPLRGHQLGYRPKTNS
jgi:hypothetical protein